MPDNAPSMDDSETESVDDQNDFTMPKSISYGEYLETINKANPASVLTKELDELRSTSDLAADYAKSITLENAQICDKSGSCHYALNLFGSAAVQLGTIYNIMCDEDYLKDPSGQDILNGFDKALDKYWLLIDRLSDAFSGDVKQYTAKRYLTEFQANLDKWPPLGQKAIEIIGRTLDTAKIVDWDKRTMKRLNDGLAKVKQG